VRPALADCLDAYAAPFTALRIARGEHELLAGARNSDAHGGVKNRGRGWWVRPPPPAPTAAGRWLSRAE